MKSSGIKNSLNLIRHDVNIRNSARKEINWYARLNILVIVVVTAFGAASHFGRLYIEQSVELKKKELVEYANANVNTQEKQKVSGKVNLLNSRFSMYQDVHEQGIDINNFYEEIKELYPEANVQKIEIRPGATDKYVEIELPNDAYEKLPVFLKALSSSEKYRDTKVTGVNFVKVNNVDTAVVKMNVVIN